MEQEMKRDRAFRVGGTNKFPDGKLHPGDEGELRFAVARDSHGRVHIDFGKDVSWLALPPEMAIQLGKLLLTHAGAKKIEIEL